jgi:hypothetical protein
MSAQGALKTTTGEREKRIRDLRAEIDRVEGLASRAKALVANLPAQQAVPVSVR